MPGQNRPAEARGRRKESFERLKQPRWIAPLSAVVHRFIEIDGGTHHTR